MLTTTKRKPLCCVRGCSAIHDNIREALFIFPANRNPRAKRWMEMFPHSFVRHPEAESYICGRHFTPECFNKDGGLLHRADPTVNIDTSYAQDPMKKIFLMKVIYEWAIRNSVDVNTMVGMIMKKGTTAKSYIGVPNLVVGAAWHAKFLTFINDLQFKGTRYGSGQKGPKQLLNVIKDIREQLPRNISLPADYIDSTEEDLTCKQKGDEDNDESVSSGSISLVHSIFANEESADEPFQTKDFVPLKSLDTYEEALELLQPLREYIRRTGNDGEASSRLREIETVVKQAIKNESKARKASKRKR